MPEELRTVKITAVLTPSQAAALDAWRAPRRWSRSTALATLIDQHVKGDADGTPEEP